MKSLFIIGPSGSGKSTLSQYLSEIYKSLFGLNSVVLINLDPANPSDQQTPYDIDMNDLVTIEDIMEEFSIGPNGAMLYAMKFLFQNKEWLQTKIIQQISTKQPHYKISNILKSSQNNKNIQTEQLTSPLTIIYDLPGQVQLYLQNQQTKDLIKHLQKKFSDNSCILELFDSTYIYQVNDFVSLCMMSLVTMINLQMPHINILNKIDVIKGQRPGLGILNEYFDFYSMKGIIQDLTFMDQDKKDGLKILNSISQVIDQYNQVSFIPCSVYKIQLIKYIILQIQKTFNTHQINKVNSPKYMQFISTVDRSFAKQQIVTELQNQLFKDQQESIKQQQMQIQKVLAQIKAQTQLASVPKSK